jgi:hypothetical protein
VGASHLVVEHGANIGSEDGKGRAAIQVASKRGHHDIAKFPSGHGHGRWLQKRTSVQNKCSTGVLDDSRDQTFELRSAELEGLITGSRLCIPCTLASLALRALLIMLSVYHAPGTLKCAREAGLED